MRISAEVVGPHVSPGITRCGAFLLQLEFPVNARLQSQIEYRVLST